MPLLKPLIGRNDHVLCFAEFKLAAGENDKPVREAKTIQKSKRDV